MKAVAIAFFLMSPQLLACGCDQPRTVTEALARSPDYVFKGRVIAVATAKTLHATIQDVTFAITKLLHGRVTGTITVEFQEGGTSCDLEKVDFHEGENYLISARRMVWAPGYWASKHPDDPTPPERYSNNFCSLRERIGVMSDPVLSRLASVQNGQNFGISHIDIAQNNPISGMPAFMKSVKR